MTVEQADMVVDADTASGFDDPLAVYVELSTSRLSAIYRARVGRPISSRRLSITPLELYARRRLGAAGGDGGQYALEMAADPSKHVAVLDPEFERHHQPLGVLRRPGGCRTADG